MDFILFRDNLTLFGQIIAPFVYLLSAIYAVKAVKTSQGSAKENIAINRRNKRADAIMHCNSRYDELQKLKISIADLRGQAQKTAVVSYYARYWGLKSDEFDYWLAGLIDIETFCNWNALTLKAFKANAELAKGDRDSDFIRGWAELGKQDNAVPNPWFSEFTEELLKISADDGLTSAGFDEMLNVIEVVEMKSEEFRVKLRNNMTVGQYRANREKYKKLGLSRDIRDSAEYKEQLRKYKDSRKPGDE